MPMNKNTSRLLFVTGASRSGTTMLNRVLGRHTQILGMNELHFFGDIWNPTDDSPINDKERIRLGAWILARQTRGIWGEGPSASEQETAKAIVAGMPDQGSGWDVYARVAGWLAQRHGKVIACEQTPRNIFYAKQLLERDQDVRIIQLIRDPRAVVASQKNRWRRKKLGGGTKVPWWEVTRVWFNYHPYTMAKLWVTAANVGDSLAGHPRFIQIRFEDLVSKPEENVVALCAFVGAVYQPAMLDVPIKGSSQRKDQGGRGFSTESVDSWKSVLSAAEVWVVERVAGAGMRTHGYELAAPSPGLAIVGLAARYFVHAIGVAVNNPRRAWIQARALFGVTAKT